MRVIIYFVLAFTATCCVPVSVPTFIASTTLADWNRSWTVSAEASAACRVLSAERCCFSAGEVTSALTTTTPQRVTFSGSAVGTKCAATGPLIFYLDFVSQASELHPANVLNRQAVSLSTNFDAAAKFTGPLLFNHNITSSSLNIHFPFSGVTADYVVANPLNIVSFSATVCSSPIFQAAISVLLGFLLF